VSEEPTQNLPQDGVRQILARLDSIDSRLTTLEERVDRRLQETRPIWEQVITRLDGFDNRLASLEGRFDGFDRRLDGFETELHSSLRRFGRQVGQLAKDVMEVRADQTDLDRRMDQLETKPTQ
jgi:tetrahydromethanopterin S-methyltransferase subunit G